MLKNYFAVFQNMLHEKLKLILELMQPQFIFCFHVINTKLLIGT